MRFRHQALAALGCLPLLAQNANRAGNPFAGNAEAIASGEKLYGVRCAVCHGRDGKGGEGPSLHKSRLVVLSPDRRFFDVVKLGIPGTEMPPMPGPDEPVWQVVAYVHSIAKPGTGPPVAGDPAAGREVFHQVGCVRCHMAGGKGGVAGPDLSSIAIQSSTAAIRESILDPAARVHDAFRHVIVRTRQGVVKGFLKNEDNFSLQLMTPEGELRSFLRSEAVKVQKEPGSMMPAEPGKRLAPDQLQNLLAFLDRQRAPFLRSQIGFQNY